MSPYLTPTSALPNYLTPGSNGYITVDWNKFRQATGYDTLLAGATLRRRRGAGKQPT